MRILDETRRRWDDLADDFPRWPAPGNWARLFDCIDLGANAIPVGLYKHGGGRFRATDGTVWKCH